LPTIFAHDDHLDAHAGPLARPLVRASARRGGVRAVPPRQPAWLREVAAAVQAEIEARPGVPARVDLGPARPEPSTERALTATFRVDLRGVRVDVASLTDLWLAPPGDPACRSEVAEIVAHAGDLLLVRATAQPGDQLHLDHVHLFATSDPLPPLRALLDALGRVRRPGLAERFDSKVLDPVPPGPHVRPGLGPEEAAAWAAGCSAGFNLVWTPPGTDKTRVIAEVVAQLALTGRRVLLVSATAAAVDQAVLEASRVMAGAWPGRIVRVGHPSLLELAEHPFLRLERACESLADGHRGRLAEVERRVADLRAEPDLLVLERAERLLAGFDGPAYELASVLVANAERLATLQGRLDERVSALAAAGAERVAAAAEVERTDAAIAETRQARRAYQQADTLQRELDAIAGSLHAAREAVRLIKERLAQTRRASAEHAELPVVRRVARLGAANRHRLAQRELEAELVPAWEQVVRLERRAGQVREQAEGLEESARPFTREDLARRDLARERALERLDAAVRAERDHDRARRELGHEVSSAARAPQPSPADVELVRAADEQSLPELAARAAELRAAARPITDELDRLGAERRRLAADVERLAPAVVADAAVVATTLATLASDPAVRGRPYDHVLVDEASAALPPHVVYAATRAGAGVTLFGDFLQNGPPSAIESSKALPVSRWLLRDSFAVLGIDRPARALASRGCAVLGEQQRLGPATAELANRVAYDYVLRTVPASRPALPDDGLGELVLVDVAGFGALARVRAGVASGRREWWPAGALVGRAIAAYHEQFGQPVALLAPHASQDLLTQAAVLDAGLDQRVEVGTPHRFQGRELPVAVFDLVEDWRERGWLARGRIGGTRHELRALRLFDVGATRATGRTYLLADRLAVERATGGPLARIREMVGEGRISVAAAGRFVPLRRCPGTGEAVAAVPPALPAYEPAAFFGRLERDLAAARGEVWVWSPFLATRPRPVLPWLVDAAERGCRVTVFVKPGHEHRPNDRRRVGALRDAGIAVVGVYGLAERLVVVDGRLSFLGNLSVLGTPRERGEAMVGVEGGRFAARLLDLTQAEAFSAPPACSDHPGERCHAQHYRRGREKGWFWTCPRCDRRTPVVLGT